MLFCGHCLTVATLNGIGLWDRSTTRKHSYCSMWDASQYENTTCRTVALMTMEVISGCTFFWKGTVKNWSFCNYRITLN